MKVFIDPACNINYCSFYIKGLWEVFGRKNIIFTSKGFEELFYTTDSHNLAFIIEERKYVIDCADSNQLFYDCFLKWADVYGKVNYNPLCIPSLYRNKIKHIGANFGIGCFGSNKWSALAKCLTNYIKSRHRLKYGFRSFLSPYLWLYKRAGTKWEAGDSRVGKNSIFMVSRYWRGQAWVNEARIAFIRACRRLENEGLITFQGGMVPDYEDNDCPEDVRLAKEIPLDEYMTGLKESLLVFNTPAYHHCHGWKLPEFLATGKIILSTPFVNELPVALKHKENVYFTNADEDSIYDAIKEIISNIPLQKSLERGSREYWDNYASPKSCITQFLGN